MKGNVLATEDRFVVVLHQKVAFYPSRDPGGQWRATAMEDDKPSGWFGPAFATKDEAHALCRAAAVALAEGTGDVFGEAVTEAKPEAPAEPEVPRAPKVGMQVTCVEVLGMPVRASGVIARVYDDGSFSVLYGNSDRAEPHDVKDFGRRVVPAPQDRATLAAGLGVSESTLLGWLRVARGDVLPARAAGRAPPPEEAQVAAWGLLEAHGRQVAEVLGRLAPAPGDKALESASDASKGASFRRFRALEAARERVEAACQALALAAELGDDEAADRAVALRVVVGLRRPRPSAPALPGSCPNCGDPHSDCPCPA